MHLRVNIVGPAAAAEDFENVCLVQLVRVEVAEEDKVRHIRQRAVLRRPDASHAVAASPAGQARHHAGGANGHGGTSGGKGYGQSTTSRVNSGAQSAKYGWVVSALDFGAETGERCQGPVGFESPDLKALV